MAVRIRMKRMGRTHRAFFRICAMDQRKPRDGKVLEELGTYDPFVPDTDARAVLKKDRIDYWLSVGAQPSEKVAVLIKKYGTDGTSLAAQEAALAKLAGPKVIPDAGSPVSKPKPVEEKPSEPVAAESPAPEAPVPAAETEAASTPPAEAEQTKPDTEQASAEEGTTEESKSDENETKEEAASE